MQRIAECRVKAMGLQQGRDTYKGEMGVLVGQVRRILSVTAVRAQAECLISRVRRAGLARKRRYGAEQQELRWQRERGAQEVGRRQGRGLVRRGCFLIE